MGFTKLDEGILQSSVMGEDPEVFKIFIALLASCREDGFARISPIFLESVTKIPIDRVMDCLSKLEEPDKYSRSTNDEGRRIRRIDGGFEIINYNKYRERKYSLKAGAIRVRKCREDAKERETALLKSLEPKPLTPEQTAMMAKLNANIPDAVLP